jgi:hypothetical protein
MLPTDPGSSWHHRLLLAVPAVLHRSAVPITAANHTCSDDYSWEDSTVTLPGYTAEAAISRVETRHAYALAERPESERRTDVIHPQACGFFDWLFCGASVVACTGICVGTTIGFIPCMGICLGGFGVPACIQCVD